MRRLLVVVSFAVVMPVAVASAVAKPVGFQADLKDRQHIECSLVKSTLSCLNYTETPSGTCDAGGAVAGLVLTRNATKPRAKTFCVDEGYHGWTHLKAGHSWSRNGFTCRVRKGGTALTCSNARGNHVLWTATT